MSSGWRDASRRNSCSASVVDSSTGGAGSRSAQRVVVAAILDHVDRALLELAEHRLALERVQLERLQHLCEPRRAHTTAFLSRLQEHPQLVAEAENVEVDDHVAPCTITSVMSSRRNDIKRGIPSDGRAHPIHKQSPHRRARAKVLLLAKCGQSLTERPCRFLAARLACRLHRARSAGRSKSLSRVVRGSGKPAGTADESATGSVN